MKTYQPRYLELGNHSCFIFGPRGTGKSTFIKHQVHDALWVDLRESDQFRSLQARPDRLKDMVYERPRTKIIVIDEIQRIPDLLPVIHKLIEENKLLQFVMTGSSARKLKKQGVDLLGGRAIRKELHPFMVTEILNQKGALDQWLAYGMLPIIFDQDEEHKRAILNTYLSLYMEQEVYQESLVRQIGNFAHFLEIISLSHGSILNISNISRDCGISRKTVEGYIQILEDILLAFRLAVFSKKVSRDQTHHPKFYLFDAGVYQTIRPRGPLDNSSEILGYALEGLIAQHLKAWLAYTPLKNQLYFWRNRYQHEVDFVLYGESGFYAIEVKSSATVRSEDFRGIHSFLEEYPEAKAILLYRGSEVLMKGNIQVVPVEQFLRMLVPGRFSVDFL